MEGARVQQEGKLQNKEGKQNQNLNSKKAANVPSGIHKRGFLLSWGAWRLTLATPRGSLSPQGSIFEPQWSQKWVRLIGVRHLGMILELPGWIWGAVLHVFLATFS